MMIRKEIAVALLFCFFCSNLFAEIDLAELEELERQQIISELSYRLETKQNCSATLVWDDAGSGADLDGYFFLPEVKAAEYMIGGHASQKRRSKYHCVTTVSEASDNPKAAPALLVAPKEWKQIWKDSGSGATRDGSFWQAISPDSNYVCLGSVAQLNHNTKPNLANYRCVHKSLTEKIVSKTIVWSDKGSGADKQVTIFNLPNTTTFIAVAARTDKAEVYDLKKNASSVPDAKKVEEILSQRMAPIKADIEAKAKALKEKSEAAKKAAAEEEEKIAAAKKAEQKKQAAAAEKKKQEAAQKKIEEKALAEKAKAEQEKRDAEAAQKLAEKQQARIAKAMAEKETAEKAKQIAEREKEELAKAQQEQAKAEEIKQTDVSIEEKTDDSAETDIVAVDESSTVETSESGSKGLNDILMFFLNIFGMMVGGVIVFMIAFKVLFGKKASS